MKYPEPASVVPDPKNTHCFCLKHEGDNDRCPMHGAMKAAERFTPIEFLIGFWVVVSALCAVLVFVLVR